MASSQKIVGGGTKKILYTLSTLKRIGLRNSTKALNSKNACKACGLGMGGQKGGMVNELGEFPSVCNKSVQAQSTDIQPAIPHEIFKQHTLNDFQELSGYEIEHLGRLDTPLWKSADSNKYTPVSWDEALNKISDKMNNTPANRSFFYSSGRSSNEAGFLFQLLARVYGSNNVNNCSYYCHQATGVALQNTIGSGTATVELNDLTGADLVFLIGANPASNHPRLIHKLKDLRERGGQVIVINPAKEPGLVRFAVPKSPKSLIFGGTEIASAYLQPRIGSDLAVLYGIAKATLEINAGDDNFIANHTENFEEFLNAITLLTWEDVCEQSGLDKNDFFKVATMYAQSKASIFCWGMGITHHTHGVDNVEAISNLALLRGMVGKPYAGLLPLRGHSNVQGIGTIGVKPVLPDDVFKKIEEHYQISLPTHKGMDTLACLEAAENKHIDFALIMGGNLYAASPNLNWAAKSLDNITLKVFLTTTLNQGHVNGCSNSESIILPVKARDEEHQPTTQESMFNFVRYSDGGIQRLASIRSETEVLAAIGSKLKHENKIDFLQFNQHRTTRESIAAIVPGLEKLKDIDTTKKEFHIDKRILHTATFNTPNNKARFLSHALPTRKANKNFPFTLMTVRSEGQFNTIVYEEQDSYRGTQSRWVVLLNEKDVRKLNVSVNDFVDLHSEYGEMKRVKIQTFDLPEGDAMAYFPEANILIGCERDARSQTPSFKSTPIAIFPHK